MALLLVIIIISINYSNNHIKLILILITFIQISDWFCLNPWGLSFFLILLVVSTSCVVLSCQPGLNHASEVDRHQFDLICFALD